MRVYHISSESCSFDNKLKYLGEIKPGCVNYVKNDKDYDISFLKKENDINVRFCLFV